MLFLLQASAQEPLEHVTLQLKWRHQFQFAGYYAAKAKGFYADAGLEVDILEAQPDIHPAEEVGSGRAQYGVGMPYLMVERAQGAPVVILAAVFQHSPEVFLTLESSSIKRGHDLRGKRIALAPYSTPACLAMLDALEIEPTDYTAVPLGFGVDQLIKGEVDAISAYVTDEPFMLEEKGVRYRVLSPTENGIDFYGDCLITSEDELTHHRDRAHRFRQASLKGWRYALDHPAEIVEIIRRDYAPELSREHLEYEAKTMRSLIVPDLVDLGDMSKERWERIRDTFASLGALRPEFDITNLLYQPVPTITRAEFQRIMSISLLASGALGGLLLWAYLAMRKRHRQAVEMETILNTAVQAIISTDENGAIYAANQGACDMFGYSIAMLRGMRLHQLFVQDKRNLLGKLNTDPAYIEELALRGLNADVVGKRQDGSTFPAHLSLGHSFASGRHLFVLVVDDLTERRRVERELAESEHRLQTVIDNMHSVFFIKDREGKHLLVNNYYEQATGVAPERVIGKRDHDFFPEAVAEAIHAVDQEVMTTGKQLRFEESVPNPDGTVHYYTTEKLPLRDADGNVVGLVGIATDITERRLMETELRTQQERLNLTLRAANLGLWDWWAREDVLHTNNLWAEMLGFHPEELHPPTRALWESLVHPEDLERAQLAVAEHFQAATPMFNCEVRMRTKGGDWKWVLSTGQVIARTAEGEVERFSGINIDIDNFKHLQAELEQSREAAEEAARAKSRFLANMSHEIRTPMNAVLNLAELLMDTPLDERQMQFLRVMHSSAKSLLRLINDVLDLSKIEAGRLELEEIPFRLSEVLEELSLVYGEQAAQKGIELRISTGGGIPPMLSGDIYRLRQVLVNLVANAIKFTAEGHVEVAVRVAVPPNGSGKNIRLHFAISDTGIGISPEQQDRLFDMFSQADSSTTRKFGGTGLGLAISERLVKAMGGAQIGLVSVPGEGSSFHFTLPFAVLEDTGGAAEQSLHGLKVLVVEENPAARNAYLSMLGRFGAGSAIAPSAREAETLVEAAEKDRKGVEVALVSWHLPSGDSPRHIEFLRTRSKPVPCIAVVGLASPAELERLRELGVESVLRKPVSGSEIYDALMTVFRGRSVPTRPEPAGPATPNKLLRFDGTRVLLVEDNRVNQMVAREMLSRRGFEITLAENGRIALELLGKDHFDLVLMDVQMPEIDGLEATRMIRSLEENRRREQGKAKRMPIIAMTANAMQGDERICLDAGMDAYVPKPLDIDLVIERIKQFVSPTRSAA